MTLNESIVEDVALIMPGATLTRPLPRGKEKRLNPAIAEEARAMIRQFRRVRI